MGYEDGKDPKSKYQHSRMSTYPNNSVRCHFEDDLEIFLTNSMGMNGRSPFNHSSNESKAMLTLSYLMMEKDKDSAPDIRKHCGILDFISLYKVKFF
jgi:hypothetical protein